MVRVSYLRLKHVIEHAVGSSDKSVRCLTTVSAVNAMRFASVTRSLVHQ